MNMRKSVFATLVALAGVVVFAAEWKPYEKNPVLGNAKLGTCFDVNVLTDGPAPYTMYFSWRSGGNTIALVRSQDGFNWTQEPEICLRPDPTSGWENALNRTTTVKKDDIWHMWYTGQVFPKDGKPGWSKIGYATSKDGVTFTRVRKTPVMVPTLPWEKTSIMNPYVRWDAARGVWRMWYAGGEQYEPNVLGYAESKDGLAWEKRSEPILVHGDPLAWDRDRIGACEVHPLPDGTWVMFYIGYSDIHTARIGCAFSKDGVTGWRRSAANPIVQPEVGKWNSSACYKPSVVRDAAHNRWMLYYNGRNGAPEYVGMSVHEGLDLEAAAPALPDTTALLKDYVRTFNAKDEEVYTNAIPNAAAEAFMLANCPRFACPDKDVERTYYFRWWTYRKHLRHDVGCWTVTEFLPKVPWSGKDNTIVCPAGHHLREGRWLRDPRYIADYARFWLSDKEATHRWVYSSWLFTGTCQFAENAGLDNLPAELLDDAVAYYRRWEQGFVRGKLPMGGDGKGGFVSIDNYEGTEISLGGQGYKPLLASAMYSEARAIAAVAEKAGRKDLAAEFRAKAETNRRSILEHSWNDEVKFFTTAKASGEKGTVRELHGYAPWYFGVPTDGREPDFAQLVDPRGFYGRFGLSFAERRAKGWTIDYKGHECKWNGPSWPFATSVALTAYMNWLHSQSNNHSIEQSNNNFFPALLWQYAAQQKRQRSPKSEGDYTVVPWIDENCHPDKMEWISRKIILETPSMLKNFPKERGKDYNHSSFCDLVINGLVGFLPKGAAGFEVDPLFPASWDHCVLENVRYRGHDVDVRWNRATKTFAVSVDGTVAQTAPAPTRLSVNLDK